MTNKAINKNSALAFVSIITITLTFVLTIVFSDKIAHSVKSGLSLCANVIIPSVFPFIVLSDFLYAYIDFSSLNCIGEIFERLFKVNRVGLYPFMLGILCGFPLGVKCSAELYSHGKLTKDETERLIGFCNNTGPAFLVCGVGLGLRGSIYEGILLYAVMVASAILTGTVFSLGKSKSEQNIDYCNKHSFSITDSIKNAGVNTINICSYLTFFACIVGLLRNAIGENIFYLSLIPFLEVGSATSILSKTKLLTSISSISLSAFAVGFSGFSVHLQALSFLSGYDLSTKRYFLMKLLQGVVSSLLTMTFYYFLF